MSGHHSLEPEDLKRRVSTRLAWLEIRHKDFAAAIDMDKGLFSRVLRREAVREDLFFRIAAGLGISPQELLDTTNREILTSDHVALKGAKNKTAEARVKAIRRHVSAQSLPKWKKHGHKDEEDRFKRRLAVRDALERGTFCLEVANELASEFKVSKSLIYADRTLILDMEAQQPILPPEKATS